MAKKIMKYINNELHKVIQEDSAATSQSTTLININSRIKLSDVKIIEDDAKLTLSIANIPHDKIIPLPSNITSLFIAIEREDDPDTKVRLTKLKDDTMRAIQKEVYNILVKNLRKADVRIGADIRNLLSTISGQ